MRRTVLLLGILVVSTLVIYRLTGAWRAQLHQRCALLMDQMPDG
jgi:hypothetical protein